VKGFLMAVQRSLYLGSVGGIAVCETLALYRK
jgi:hypothetical protein